MRTINKLPEPRSLARHREAGHSDFANLPAEAKQELREQLVKEQQGLCCYCDGRIRAAEGSIKVEHWKSQRNFPEHQLDYWNLLGACMGNEGCPGGARDQHCDTRKGQKPLSRNPANPSDRVGELIHYLTDGSIRSTDPQLDSELGEDRGEAGQNSERILNLNLPFLKNNRKAVLDAFKQGLQQRGQLQEITLRNLLTKWAGDQGGTLDPYSPVVAFWLKKRLERS